MPKKRRDFDKNLTPTSAVVVSYVPLLIPKSNPLERDVNESSIRALLEEVDACPSGHVQGCIWLSDSQHVQPVFVMENGRLIADHLLMWSQNCPSDWFTLCFAQRDDRYGIVLFPNIQKSVQRFQESWLLQFGERISPKSCHVVFRYLHFTSGRNHVFGDVRDRLPVSTRLGLVDAADLDLERILDVDPCYVRTVGPVGVCWDCKPFGMDISGILDNLFDPGSEDSAEGD